MHTRGWDRRAALGGAAVVVIPPAQRKPPATPKFPSTTPASLLSEIPTCTDQIIKDPLSSYTIGGLPAGMFLRNPLVGAATWMASRRTRSRQVGEALGRRSDRRDVLRVGRSPRQEAR